MFRRIRRQNIRRVVMTSAQLEILSKANRLVQAGQFNDAATIMVQLAQEMERTNHPRRAANLHAMAAHTYADGRNESAALSEARLALNLFIQYKIVERTPRFYANITRKLNAGGMKAAAQTLQTEYGGQIGALPPVSSTSTPTRHGRLPAACPKCGAAVRSDEASWVDESTAECMYCGSLIKTEA
jgi:hypothetical protein